MIDASGHIIHIDFGFVFGLAPGKAFSLEKAPWKLTVEMVDVMGGLEGAPFKRYKALCVDAFRAARAHAREVEGLMEIMAHKSVYPAFKYCKTVIPDFRKRLMLDRPDDHVPAIVEGFVKKSYDYSGTRLYDKFQLATNEIAI